MISASVIGVPSTFVSALAGTHSCQAIAVVIKTPLKVRCMFIFAKNKRCAAATGIPSGKHPGYSCTCALPNKKRVVPESTTLRHPDRGDSRDTRKHVALNTTNLQFQALASLSIQALRFAPLPSRAQTGTRNR